MVPKSDIERFIQAIIDDSDAPSAAKCRIEQYLTDILEERVSTLEPVFRIEYYLAKISGADVELPEPISRADLYLSALAGAEVTLPDSPNSSLEEYLAKWCETGAHSTAINLLNTATNITGKFISASGGISNGDDAQYTDLIPVTEGETYVCSLVNGRNSGTNRWHGYDANGGWVKQLAFVKATGQQGAKLVMTATIDSGISYVRLSYGITDTEAMIEEIDFTHSIADKFYEGLDSNSIASLRSLNEIQSPFTSGGTARCPATLYSVEPGKMYTAKNNVPPAVQLTTGFYASIDDVTDATKSVGHTGQQVFTVPDGANYAVTTYLKTGTGTTYTFDKPMVSEVSINYKPYVAP